MRQHASGIISGEGRESIPKEGSHINMLAVRADIHTRGSIQAFNADTILVILVSKGLQERQVSSAGVSSIGNDFISSVVRQVHILAVRGRSGVVPEGKEGRTDGREEIKGRGYQGRKEGRKEGATQ